MEFSGVKIALRCEGKLLMYLRDNKPGLFQANMWDFFGGGREGDETPFVCIARELREELGVILEPSDIVWQKTYPSQKDPKQIAYFMVGDIQKEQLDGVVLTEGQRWALIPAEDFLVRADVIPALKTRYQDYLNTVI